MLLRQLKQLDQDVRCENDKVFAFLRLGFRDNKIGLSGWCNIAEEKVGGMFQAELCLDKFLESACQWAIFDDDFLLTRQLIAVVQLANALADLLHHAMLNLDHVFTELLSLLHLTCGMLA